MIVTDVVTPLDGLRAALPHAEVIHSERDTSIAEDADDGPGMAPGRQDPGMSREAPK